MIDSLASIYNDRLPGGSLRTRIERLWTERGHLALQFLLRESGDELSRRGVSPWALRECATEYRSQRGVSDLGWRHGDRLDGSISALSVELVTATDRCARL